MDLLDCKHLRLNSRTCKCLALVIIAITTAVFLPTFYGIDKIDHRDKVVITHGQSLDSKYEIREDRFVEVPQIVWGLNNQKIAVARALLTARMLNRTLLMPSLSASLFYKELDLLQPISFDKVFQFERFNSICNGFVRLGRFSNISNQTDVIELEKGSGRKWTVDRDFEQLKQFRMYPYDEYEVIRVNGKNPFLWHDHWSVQDYSRVFECLVLVDKIAKEADIVVAKIREVGTPYAAVHMRIEKDWMIHCKKLEQRSNISQICSSKSEIILSVGNINITPVYLAVADSLLENDTILDGWKEGIVPLEKKKLGVFGIYKKYPYLIQSAIDYEVCLRADVFVGNSFSTFSSLVVLERTQKMIQMGEKEFCGAHVRWPSYAYNIAGEVDEPQRWVTNMSDSSLRAISYGTNKISC